MEEEREITSYFSQARKIISVRDGKTLNLINEDKKKVESALMKMCEKAVQMPAFGVSLDALIRSEMQRGVWLRLIYENTQICSGMPFTELAFQIVPEYGGFNLCRLNNGAYEGRCFYLDLRGKDMSALYGVLTGL